MHCLNRNLLGGFSPVKRTSVLYFDLKEFFVCFFEVFFFFNQCSRHGSSYSNAGLSFHYLFGPLVWFRIKYFNNFLIVVPWRFSWLLRLHPADTTSRQFFFIML